MVTMGGGHGKSSELHRVMANEKHVERDIGADENRWV